MQADDMLDSEEEDVHSDGAIPALTVLSASSPAPSHSEYGASLLAALRLLTRA